MLENLEKNGSYLERRKVFVELPFHSLNHNASLQWAGQGNPTQEQQRRQMREFQEHNSLRRSYEMKIQQKLREKYLRPVDTYRVIPNQITRRKDQQALSRQIEQFNTSKLTPNSNPQLQEHPDSPLTPSHQSAVELGQKQRPDSKYHLPYPQIQASQNRMRYHQQSFQGQNQSPMKQSRFSPEKFEGRQSMGRYQSPYLLKSVRGPNFLPKFRKYANLANSIDLKPMDNPLLPVRNYLPDQLEGFLRENLRNQQRRRPFQASLSLGKRQGV